MKKEKTNQTNAAATMTPKEEEIMQMLWANGPMTVNTLLTLYAEPRPHFNTVSTVIRRMEAKGLVAHNDIGGSFEYYPLAQMGDFRKRSFLNLVRSYFVRSYFGAVSALVEEEKISADELRQLITLIENKKNL